MSATRFQLGRSDTDERSGLFERRRELADELARSIRQASGHGELRWQAGGESGTAARNVEEAVEQMIEAAGEATETIRIRTVPEADSGQPSVHLWVLVEDSSSLAGPIPQAAHDANGEPIASMLGFHQEISFVFPEYKTLGGYVPRPIKDEIPDGWETGDPWPMFGGRLAFASEHAWGGAVDAAKSNDHGGFDQGPTLKPLLQRITDYALANRKRLGLVHHIFDHHEYHANNDFRKDEYNGSDAHETHTHSAFGEHSGKKPPWL